MPDFDDDPYNEGYAESSLQTEVVVCLGIADSLRLLISRKLIVKTSTKTDVIVTRSYSKSDVGILPPGSRTHCHRYDNPSQKGRP